APFGQKHVLYRPVEAAGAAQPGDVPAPGHDLGLGAGEHAAPVERLSLRAQPRLAVVENLEAAQHPGAFLAAAAEAPAAADAVAALDRHRLSAALHRGAGDDGVGAGAVKFAHAVVGQAEGDELADAVVGEVPADRAGPLGEQLDNPQIGQR